MRLIVANSYGPRWLFIEDFRIVDYDRSRRFDACSLDWVDYGKRVEKFDVLPFKISPSDRRRFAISLKESFKVFCY